MTPAALILLRLGAKSWTELYERTVSGPREGDLMQALLSEGLVSEVDLRKRMIRERLQGAKSKTDEARAIADRYGMTESAVRSMAYR